MIIHNLNASYLFSITNNYEWACHSIIKDIYIDISRVSSIKDGIIAN